jgi:hypothetical protein
MACLTIVKERNPDFIKLIEKIKTLKCENKILEANLEMLKLKMFMQENPNKHQPIIELCKKLIDLYREIGSLEGEALAFYILAS